MAAKKIKLSDVLTKRERNTEIPTKDAKHRRDHVKYRSPRDRMILKATPFQRKLSGDAAEDMRRHEVAREFINNGMDHVKAYRAIYGNSKGAAGRATAMFNSHWMRHMVLQMLQGTDTQEEIPKEYAVDKLIGMIETNVLDYMTDEGLYLNVQELKALPRFAQEQIKKLEIRTTSRHRPVLDNEGKSVKDENGQVVTREVVDQHVKIELWDKQKAIESLAKVQKWIEDKGDINLYMGDIMIEAEQRVDRMKEGAIEGTAERVTSD